MYDVTFKHLTESTLDPEEHEVMVIGGHRYPILTGHRDGRWRLCRNYCLCFFPESEPISVFDDIDPHGSCPNSGKSASEAVVLRAIVKEGQLVKNNSEDDPLIILNRLLLDTRVFRAFEETWVSRRPGQQLPSTVGGHRYPGVFGEEFFLTSECANLCGCRMGSSQAFAPNDERTYPGHQSQYVVGTRFDDGTFLPDPADIAEEGSLDPEGACPYAGIQLLENPMILALAASEQPSAAEIPGMNKGRAAELLDRWDVRWALSFGKQLRNQPSSELRR